MGMMRGSSGGATDDLIYRAANGDANALYVLRVLQGSYGSRDNYGSAFDDFFSKLNTPLPPPPKGYGGEKDALLPVVTGTQSKADPFGPLVIHYGEVKTFLKLAANAYSVSAGASSVLYLAADVGIGEYEITNLKIGSKLVSQISGAYVEYRYGTSGDAALTYYTQDVDEKIVDNTLPYAVQRVVRTGQECDAIQVEVNFDQGLWQLNTYYDEHGRPYNLKQGSLVYINFWVTNVATGVQSFLGTVPFSQNLNSPYRTYASFNVARGVYDVTVQKATADGNGSTVINECSWTTLRSFLHEPPFRDHKDRSGNRVNIARVALQIYGSTENNGVLDQLNAVVKRKIPVWNGTTWSTIFSQNPAWIVYDLLTGQHNLDSITNDEIDLAQFLLWAQFCEQKGIKFNGTFEDPDMTIREAIDLVCYIGRAKFFVKDDKYSIWFDGPKATCSALFTPHNLTEEGGLRIDPYVKNIPHYIRAPFINKEADYQQDERWVYDDGYTEANALIWEKRELFGCTDKDQTWRQARYEIAKARLRPSVYTLTTDIEGLSINSGDKFRLCHPWVAMIGSSHGRITARTMDGSNCTAITFNNTVDMESGKQYQIRVQPESGEPFVIPIQTYAGPQNTLIFTDPVAGALFQVGNVIAVGELNKDSIELLATEVTYEADFVTTIKAVDYSPAIFDAESGTIPPYVTPITIPHSTQVVVPQPVILSVISDERVLKRDGDGHLVSRIMISLAAPRDPRVTAIRARYRIQGNDYWDSTSWAPADDTSRIYLDSVEDRLTYEAQVRFMFADGNASEWTTMNPHTVIGKTTRPPAPTNLRRRDGLLDWYYDASKGVTPPLDLAGFVVKMHWGDNENWNTAVTLAEFTTSTQFDISGFDAGGIKTFMVKAIDVVGLESETAQICKINFDDVAARNLIYSTSHHPTWPGTKTACAVDSGVLKANDNGGKFYPAGNVRFYGDDKATRLFYGITWSEATYEFTYRPPVEYVSKKDAKIRLAVSASGPFKIEYRVPRSNILFYGDGTRLFYRDPKATTKFYGEDNSPYIPMPDDGVDLRNMTYQFKVTLLGGTTRSQINSLDVICDIPDILINIEDQAIDIGGSRLDLGEVVLIAARVQGYTIQDATTTGAKSLVVLDNDPNGPLVQLFDKDGDPVAGNIDAVVRGHR